MIVFVLFFAYANAQPITTGLVFPDQPTCQAEAARLMAANVTPTGQPITSYQCNQVTLP